MALTVDRRGRVRIEVEVERLGPPGSDWRAILADRVYRGQTPGEVLELLAGVLDNLEAEAITNLLRREAGGLHAVTEQELEELERSTDPENTDNEEDPDDAPPMPDS